MAQCRVPLETWIKSGRDRNLTTIASDRQTALSQIKEITTMHIARTLAFTALLLVMGVGYAKTAGGAAVTTMIVMDAAQKKAEAERDGKFAATPVAQCSMCHQ